MECKDKFKTEKCDNCNEIYRGYPILICDCPDCFWMFIRVREIYGKHLCKKCRKIIMERLKEKMKAPEESLNEYQEKF